MQEDIDWYIKSATNQRGSRRVFLVTNQDNPHPNQSNLRQAAIRRAKVTHLKYDNMNKGWQWYCIGFLRCRHQDWAIWTWQRWSSLWWKFILQCKYIYIQSRDNWHVLIAECLGDSFTRRRCWIHSRWRCCLSACNGWRIQQIGWIAWQCASTWTQ